MAKFKAFIDPGLEVDPANPPANHIFVIMEHGGYFIDDEVATGVPFIMSYELSHETEKHYICKWEDGTTHIDRNYGFKDFKAAYDRLIALTEEEVERARRKVTLFEQVLEKRKAEAP